MIGTIVPLGSIFKAFFYLIIAGSLKLPAIIFVAVQVCVVDLNKLKSVFRFTFFILLLIICILKLSKIVYGLRSYLTKYSQTYHLSYR
jgi:hypothetical protein